MTATEQQTVQAGLFVININTHVDPTHLQHGASVPCVFRHCACDGARSEAWCLVVDVHHCNDHRAVRELGGTTTCTTGTLPRQQSARAVVTLSNNDNSKYDQSDMQSSEQVKSQTDGLKTPTTENITQQLFLTQNNAYQYSHTVTTKPL